MRALSALNVCDTKEDSMPTEIHQELAQGSLFHRQLQD